MTPELVGEIHARLVGTLQKGGKSVVGDGGNNSCSLTRGGGSVPVVGEVLRLFFTGGRGSIASMVFEVVLGVRTQGQLMSR